jgi:hypothetical protein
LARAAPPRPAWQEHTGVEPDLVIALLSGLPAINESLAERAVDHVLARPNIYDPDRVLVAAARTLWAGRARQHSSAIERLRAACLAHLRARVAEPLAPPTDWRRPSKLPCRCPRCTELARFLDDPERPTWIFRAAEADRSHVGETIKRARCDVDPVTDRHGRPYSLVCTKNQASYERRSRQRQQDLADLERLDGS